MESKRPYYYGIDIVRFTAATMVAIFHIGYSCWASPTSGGGKIHAEAYVIPEQSPFIWFGWTGVEIFFVISGFVIVNSAANASAWNFAWGRAARLYPAAWICATLTAALLFVEGHSNVPIRYISSMALVPTGPWIDGQYWTLGVEIMFYLVVLLMIATKLQRYFGVLAAGLILMSFGVNLAGTLDPEWTFLGGGKWRLFLLTYGTYFGIGVLLQRGMTVHWSSGSKALMLLGIVACILETRLHVMGMSTRVTESALVLADLWFLPSLATMIGIGLIALSVYGSAFFDQLPARFLSLLRQLGLATYPLYLLHFSIGIYLVRMSVTQLDASPIPSLIVVIAVLALVSWCIAYFIEPLLRRPLYRARDVLKALRSRRATSGKDSDLRAGER